MHIKLLSTADLEELIKYPQKAEGSDILHLCTIIEPIEVLDRIKKGRVDLTQENYDKGYSSLRSAGIYFEGLDLPCLQRSLFNETHRYDTVHLWEPITDIELPPSDTIRLLILRPSSETWWDEDSFAELRDRL